MIENGVAVIDKYGVFQNFVIDSTPCIILILDIILGNIIEY